MMTNESQPTWRERWAIGAVNGLQSVGLEKFAYSGTLRWLGKRILLRRDHSPKVRAIASGLGEKLKLRMLPDTPKSYWLGIHEPHMQAVIREQVKPGMVVYDCGANIGYYSAIFAELVGSAGHVYAFEPSPESLECLQTAATLNGFKQLSIVPKAVWHRTEVLHFVRGSEDKSLVTDHVKNIFGEYAESGTFIEIPATSLDEFVYKEGHPLPDFIKIDVEGAEGKAVAGARRLLSERRPPLLLEVHGTPGLEVWAILKELNYTFVNIATGDTPHTAAEFAVWITQYLAEPQ